MKKRSKKLLSVLLGRRALLLGLMGAGGVHGGPGLELPPLAVPRLTVLLDDGRQTDLASLMLGRVTALQFVLTGCSSICPVLGTIFSRVQDQIGGDPFQLVSLSLDPFHDTPRGFAAWLARFGAGPRWRGAIPQTDLAGIVALLQSWNLSRGTSSAFHTETVLLIDRTAHVVFRFADLPDPQSVAGKMQELSRL